MTNNMILGSLIFIFLFLIGSCVHKNIQINSLKDDIQILKQERPRIWTESCKRAVDMTCFYSECDRVPIEIMQDKLCEAPGDL